MRSAFLPGVRPWFTTLLSIVLFSGSCLLTVVHAPAAAFAQTSELTQRLFDRLVDEAQATDPVFGPEDGDLAHDADVVGHVFADSGFADFVAVATFQNPFAGSSHQFDFGLQFRSTGSGDNLHYLRFIVSDSGGWELTNDSGQRFAQDEYDGVDDSRRGENTLTVYAQGTTVHLAINGDYVGSAEVDETTEGRIAVGAAFYAESVKDGAVTTFTDFTVWQLGGGESDSGNPGSGPNTGVPRPPSGAQSTGRAPNDDRTKQATETPVDNTDAGKPAKGTLYTSPSYGFTFTYDSTWESQSDSSGDGIDAITIAGKSDGNTLTIYGIPGDTGVQPCLDAMIRLFETKIADNGFDMSLENSDDGLIEAGNRQGAHWTLNQYSVQTDSGPAQLVVYYECGPVAGSEYLVGIQHAIYDNDVKTASGRRDKVVDSLAPAGTGTVDDTSPDQDEPSSGSANTGTNITRGEGGRMVYVSPTYGFTVEILPEWTVEENSVQNGYDTLVVASDTGRVTVSGFSSTGTAVGCIDSILRNLNADPNLSNVGIGVQPDGTTSRWDTDTTSEMVVFFTASGVNYVRYYACFSGNDGQSMLVFAYEALEANIQAEFANIEAMLDLIRVP